MQFPIVGERTLLRPFQPSDADEMVSIYGDPEVMRFVAYGKPAATWHSATPWPVENARSIFRPD